MKQITILTRSDKDVIAEVTALLAGCGVNIDSITGEHYGTQAIVNVTVDNEESALRALHRRLDWQIISEDAVLVRVKDEIGALARIAAQLNAESIMIRSIRFVERHDGDSLIAVSADDTKAVRKALNEILAW